jgi:hypothetical protein
MAVGTVIIRFCEQSEEYPVGMFRYFFRVFANDRATGTTDWRCRRHRDLILMATTVERINKGAYPPISDFF